jgi:hypothetical protein
MSCATSTSLPKDVYVSLTPIDIPQWNGQAKNVGDIWRRTKGAHTETCALFTHPIGGEIRLDVDGERSRTEEGRNGMALVDLALEWKAQFQKKGWIS